MSDYTRGGQTFRSEARNSKELPVTLTGAHERVYKGTQTLTLTGSVQTLTVPSGATHADIVAEGATTDDYCRYFHGTTPTSSSGVKLYDRDVCFSAAPADFEVIEVSGSIVLQVEYYAYE